MTLPFHTSASGEPVEFKVSEIRCTKIALGKMDNNAYLLDAGDGSRLLIDAPDEPDRLLGLLADRPLDLVVITHRHPDHLQALAAVVMNTGAPVLAGRPDAAAITKHSGVAVRPVWSGDRIDCGALHLRVLGLVGHTPGSIALVADGAAGGQPHIFTGDSLFPGGVGRTESPADFASLLADVTREIFDRFGDDTVIHPGHGDATTVGTQRPQLAQWRARGW